MKFKTKIIILTKDKRFIPVLLLGIWLFSFMTDITFTDDLLFNKIDLDNENVEGFLIEDNTRNVDFSMFSNIHSNYYKGLKSIQFHNTFSYEGFLILFSDTIGTYKFYNIDLLNSDGISEDSLRKNFYHELGHHVFWFHLTGKERDEWSDIFRTTDEDKFISGYASTNANENMAENMEYFFDNQDQVIECYLSKIKNCSAIQERELRFIIEKVVIKLDNERIFEIQLENLRIQVEND